MPPAVPEAAAWTSADGQRPVQSRPGPRAKAIATGKDIDGYDAFTIDEISKRTGLGRTYLYKEIALRKLRARKFGRLTRILPHDYYDWLESSPSFGDEAPGGLRAGERPQAQQPAPAGEGPGAPDFERAP